MKVKSDKQRKALGYPNDVANGHAVCPLGRPHHEVLLYYITYFIPGGLVIIVMREEYLWSVPHYVYYIIYFTLGGLVIIVMREE